MIPLASAEVYRSYDDEGNVIFSDEPSADAEKIQVDEAFIYTPVDVPPLVPDASEQQAEDESTLAAAPDYQVEIITPEQDEAIRANDGNVTINVKVRPPLSSKRGDQVQLWRDGLPFGSPQTQLSFVLPNMDRGTHQFSAVVLNASGEEINRSSSHKFHVLRNSIITNPNRPITGLPPIRPAPSPKQPPSPR